MKVRVRNVKNGTRIEIDMHEDVFVESIFKFIGKIINVERHGCYDEWYYKTGDKGFNYHESWLDFNINKKPEKSYTAALRENIILCHTWYNKNEIENLIKRIVRLNKKYYGDLK